MLQELSIKLTLDDKAIKAPNLTSHFSAEDLEKLGSWVYDGYQLDKQSRASWEKRTEAAMDLAMQITKEKSFPWQNCSNVNFPLVSTAVQLFHSRAYPALVSSPEIVKCRVIGPDDKDGTKRQRANRISTHMSYQVIEEDESWEEQHDRLVVNVAVVGTAFKKSRFDSNLGHNVSELVMAKDLVLDYYAKSVETCPRKTHIIPMFRNELHEKIVRGVFRDVREETWYNGPQQPVQNTENVNQDNRHGLTPPARVDETTPYRILEQHVSCDLDGDGYAEPCLIVIEENSKAVLQIALRFDRLEDIERHKGDIMRIRAREYFTKYPFIPSPDGGIYDIGFGVFLGPLNESANSALNQIFDAGTMATLGGGFLARGVKIRGGAYTIAPYTWVRVDSSGDDLRKGIVPLQVKEPSAVLFQVLTFLVNYTQRLSGATDTIAGENPGQNTPAETSRNMTEQGMQIYNGIYKRLWRSMKQEFKKLYILNSIYMPISQPFGEGKSALREDYLGDPRAVVPAADPRMSSRSQDLLRAQTLMQSAMQIPGFDVPQVVRKYLRSMDVEDIDVIYPGPDKVPPLPNPKQMVEQMKLQGKQLEIQHKQAQLKQDKLEFLLSLQEEHLVNGAKIVQLMAQAEKLKAEASGVETGHQIAAFEAQIGALKTHDEMLTKRIELMVSAMEKEKDDGGSGEGNSQPAGMGGMAGTPMLGGPPAGNAGAPAGSQGQMG